MSKMSKIVCPFCRLHMVSEEPTYIEESAPDSRANTARGA